MKSYRNIRCAAANIQGGLLLWGRIARAKAHRDGGCYPQCAAGLRKLRALGVAASVFAGAACAPSSDVAEVAAPHEELGTARQALFGPVSFDPNTCSADDVRLLTETHALARIFAASELMSECLLTQGHYAPCTGDPEWTLTADARTRVAGILKAIHHPNPVFHNCDGVEASRGAAAATFLHDVYCNDDPVPIHWSRGYLDRSLQYGIVPVDTLLHEFAHRHDFTHGDPAGQCRNQVGSETPAPNALSWCVTILNNETQRACGSRMYEPCDEGKGRMFITAAGDCGCVTATTCDDCSDVDNDALGDRCDACVDDPVPDTDGDGHCSTDNCPSVDNASQADSDQDGLGDACDACPQDRVPDTDRDGRCSTDNCPQTWNAGQDDLDHDGVGDACDADRDGDGVPQPPHGQDNCPYSSNPSQLDTDRDGLGDACDCAPLSAFVPPGVFSAISLLHCNDVWSTTRALEVLLDDRLAAFAAAATSRGFSTTFGKKPSLERCRSCLESAPKKSPAYAHTLEYLAGLDEPEFRPILSALDFERVVLREEGVTHEDVSRFLRERIDR